MKANEKITLSVSTESRWHFKATFIRSYSLRAGCLFFPLICVLSTLPYSVFPMGKHQKYDWRKISLHNE